MSETLLQRNAAGYDSWIGRLLVEKTRIFNIQHAITAALGHDSALFTARTQRIGVTYVSARLWDRFYKRLAVKAPTESKSIQMDNKVRDNLPTSRHERLFADITGVTTFGAQGQSHMIPLIISLTSADITKELNVAYSLINACGSGHYSQPNPHLTVGMFLERTDPEVVAMAKSITETRLPSSRQFTLREVS